MKIHYGNSEKQKSNPRSALNRKSKRHKKCKRCPCIARGGTAEKPPTAEIRFLGAVVAVVYCGRPGEMGNTKRNEKKVRVYGWVVETNAKLVGCKAN